MPLNSKYKSDVSVKGCRCTKNHSLQKYFLNIGSFCFILFCRKDGWSFPHAAIQLHASAQSQEGMSKQVKYTQPRKNTKEFKTYRNLEFSKTSFRENIMLFFKLSSEAFFRHFSANGKNQVLLYKKKDREENQHSFFFRR